MEQRKAANDKGESENLTESFKTKKRKGLKWEAVTGPEDNPQACVCAPCVAMLANETLGPCKVHCHLET